MILPQVSTEATQEASLEAMLERVHDKWRGVEFTVNSYKEAKDTYILVRGARSLTTLN